MEGVSISFLVYFQRRMDFRRFFLFFTFSIRYFAFLFFYFHFLTNLYSTYNFNLYKGASSLMIFLLRNHLPFYFASSATCLYNTNTTTVSTYNEIFGGDFETATLIMPLTIFINIILSQLTASLYGLLDFYFLGFATLINFAVIYLPLTFGANVLQR